MIFLSNNGLDRLRLDASATERDVKKAYARELKLIDPAAQPQVFAELRQAYEGALAQVRFTAQFAANPGVFGQPDGEGAGAAPQFGEDGEKGNEQGDGDGKAEDAEGGTQGHRAPDAQPRPDTREEPRPTRAPQPDAAPSPAESRAPAPSPRAGRLPFDSFAETLTFSPSDLPAAQAALRHWLAQDELMLMAAREAFELELMESLVSRRFGSRTAALFLAASQAFHWDSGRHSQLERMGPAGAYVSSLLYDMAVLDKASQSRWLALTEAPDPKKALTLLKDGERMESLSPVLARLFFDDGHIQAWHRAKDHAPVLERGQKRAASLFKDSAMLRGALLLLIVPVVVGIMAAILSFAQEREAVRASGLCDGYFASAMSRNWKDVPISDIAQLNNCARGIPPLLCSDRAALLDVLGTARSLHGGRDFFYSIYGYGIQLNLSDGRRFGKGRAADCSAVLNFAVSAPWLAQGDEKAARQLVADVAQCAAAGDRTESPALLALLAQTDAWPAPSPGRAGKPIPLHSLISQPEAVPYAANPLKPWPQCAATMNGGLQARMGEKEWVAAVARANSSSLGKLTDMVKTLPKNTGTEGAKVDPEVAAATAASAAAVAAAAAR